MNESTHISNNALLTGFVWYVYQEKARVPPTPQLVLTQMTSEIFYISDAYDSKNAHDCNCVVCLYTNDAPKVTDILSGVAVRIQDVALQMTFIVKSLEAKK
jgi:hypothetical protein